MTVQERLGSAGDGEHVQGSLRKRGGGAAQAFEGFPGATMKSLQGSLQGQPILLLPALILHLGRVSRATRNP